MTPENRDNLASAVATAMTAELVVVLVIFFAAAVGVNVGAITSAIANWIN